jgi:C4-dicarboxylate transporter DctQ subunit
MIERGLKGLDVFLGHLCTVLGGLALLLSLFTMLTRYFAPSLSLDWAPEVITFLVIWTVFLAAARLAYRNAHIATGSFFMVATPAARRLAVGIATVLGILLALTLLRSGITVVAEAARWDERTASTLRIPLWIYYTSLPVGFTFVALFLIGRLFGYGPADRRPHLEE